MERTPSTKKGQQRLMAGLLALALGAAGYIVFLRPAQQELASKQQTLSALQTSAGQTGTTPTATADAETLRAAQIALPEKVDPVKVESALKARGKGIQIVSFQTEPATPATLSQGTIFHVVAVGTFPLLNPFLANLDNEVYIDPANGQIRLDQSAPPGPMMLVPNLEMHPRAAHSQLYQATFTIVIPNRTT
jgi:hypothetical protein